MVKIKQLQIEQLDEYVEHVARQFVETGIGGIIAHPFPIDEPTDKIALRANLFKKWSTKPGSGDWEVAWGLIDGEKIVGHLELRGLAMPALRHRARLGMGIEQHHRSRGYGKLLVTAATEWSKSQDFLNWIDLDVFAHNPVAVKLYESFGFRQTGKTCDRLRVNQQSIDDLHFALKLSVE